MTRGTCADGIVPPNRRAMAGSSQSTVPSAGTALLPHLMALSEHPDVIEARQRIADGVGDTTPDKEPFGAAVTLVEPVSRNSFPSVPRALAGPFENGVEFAGHCDSYSASEPKSAWLVPTAHASPGRTNTQPDSSVSSPV